MTDAPAEIPARPLTQDGPPLRLWMIDASAYIFRAYHALPPLTRKSDGLPVGAVQGYCNMLWKLLKDMKGEDGPTHLVAVFDHSEKTFRNDLYDQYKAHRPRRPRIWSRSFRWCARRPRPSASTASRWPDMKPTT